MLLLDDRLHLFLKDDSHGFVENSLEAFLREGAAFHVFAFELIFDDLPGGLFEYWCIFRVFFHDCVFVPKIDFVANEDLWHVPHVFLQLGIPLSE